MKRYQTIEYSWIVPTWNEVDSLPSVVREIKESMQGKAYEIIVVDDGSTDGSQDMATVQFHTHKGKWEAVRLGLKQAVGSVIIFCDSDGQDMPNEVCRLLDVFDQGYDVVSGWRKERKDMIIKVMVSKLGSWCLGFQDLNSPLKVYRREVLEHLRLDGGMLRFGMWQARRLGYRVVEIPVLHRQRRYGRSKFTMMKYVRILLDFLILWRS